MFRSLNYQTDFGTVILNVRVIQEEGLECNMHIVEKHFSTNILPVQNRSRSLNNINGRNKILTFKKETIFQFKCPHNSMTGLR
jgi:hypothetical protein